MQQQEAMKREDRAAMKLTLTEMGFAVSTRTSVFYIRVLILLKLTLTEMGFSLSTRTSVYYIRVLILLKLTRTEMGFAVSPRSCWQLD